MARKRSNAQRVARWDKDGYWHVLESFEPTEANRRQWPISYPLGDPGPFYRWSKEAYESKEEALQALALLQD